MIKLVKTPETKKIMITMKSSNELLIKEKYVDIAYPPNVVAIFRNDNQKFIFKDQLNEEYADEIPKTFQIFRVSPNN